MPQFFSESTTPGCQWGYKTVFIKNHLILSEYLQMHWHEHPNKCVESLTLTEPENSVRRIYFHRPEARTFFFKPQTFLVETSSRVQPQLPTSTSGEVAYWWLATPGPHGGRTRKSLGQRSLIERDNPEFNALKNVLSRHLHWWIYPTTHPTFLFPQNIWQPKSWCWVRISRSGVPPSSSRLLRSSVAKANVGIVSAVRWTQKECKEFYHTPCRLLYLVYGHGCISNSLHHDFCHKITGSRVALTTDEHKKTAVYITEYLISSYTMNRREEERMHIDEG